MGAHTQASLLPLPITLLSQLCRRISLTTPVYAVSTTEGSGPPAHLPGPLEGIGLGQDPPGAGRLLFLWWGWGFWFAKACLTLGIILYCGESKN